MAQPIRVSDISAVRMDDASEAKSPPVESRGVVRTTALNHLLGESAIDEWVKLVESGDALMERLNQTTQTRARLEAHLLLAGVTREQLNAALAARTAK